MTQAGMAEQPIPELPELSRDTGDMTPVELGPKAPSAQPHATNIQAGNTTSTGSAETPTAVAPASAARASAEPISGANAPIVGSPAARLTTPLTAAATQSAKTPVRYGLSAWFRATFDNQTPVLAHNPTQNSQVDGTVTGAVTTLGPDGHALTFTAGVPVNGGTVVIAPDGTFTYSANRTLTQTGGTDTFTVTASDEMSGRHVHGLPGLLNLITNGMLGKAGHSATISVTVAVNPVTAAAKPGTPAYLVGGVDHVTGTVSGELDANDPDPHTLTYSLTDGPSRGIVTLNPDSGAFTYTPSQTDRHQAAAENATAEQLHDTFTVTVVDGRGSATAVPVSVDVDPANTDPALNLLVSDPDSDGSVHVSVIVTDPDNDPVTYLVVHDPALGSLTQVADGYVYAPLADARENAGTVGTDSFQITATDQHHGIVTKTVTVAISPSEQAAVVEPAAAKKPREKASASTMAAVPTSSVVRQGESLVLSPAKSGSTYSDSTASGGKALLMKSNGTASTTLSLPKSTSLVIRAKGDQYKGAPTMTVYLDGQAVSTIAVSATTWTDYTIPITASAGTHTISVAYTNELRASASKDRNLRIDTITAIAGAVVTEQPAYFPAADWLWKPIASDAAVATDSATWVSYLSAPTGKRVANMYNYGVTLIPSSAITTSTPRYDVKFKYVGSWGSDPFGSYTVALPQGTKIPAGSDGHIAILDPITGQAFGIWQAKYNTKTDTWTGSWGGRTPINGNGIDQAGSATATGISRYAGVVTAAEFSTAVAANTGLNHALVFSTDIAGPDFVGPAIKSDGANMAGVATPIPEGYRVQLDPSINIDAIPGITAGEKVIAKTLQTHGAYVVDQGGARMAFIFETIPGATANNPGAVYTQAGLSWDYYDMTNIPWTQLRVLAPYAQDSSSPDART